MGDNTHIAETLTALEAELLAAIAAAPGEQELERLRIGALGRKGRIPEHMRDLGKADAATRQHLGRLLNGLKTRVSEAIEARRTMLHEAALDRRLAAERLDVSLPAPGGGEAHGRIHPLSRITEEVAEIFASLGFAVEEGPDIETEHYNFTALNIPAAHPARQMHDTFYLQPDGGGQRLLRTHTSPVQIRTMERGGPPWRFIAPGRVYRRDSDQTHTPMFHQVEGLAVDRDIHMGHLKWVLREFLCACFELDGVDMRFRPSFFPFTEPSMEVDVRCARTGGTIRIGEGDDWLEILGCGMVHPRVLRGCGVDPERFQGFAFGMGLDRLAMLKYGIPDLRAFFDADLRWLRHYGFPSLGMPSLAAGLSS